MMIHQCWVSPGLISNTRVMVNPGLISNTSVMGECCPATPASVQAPSKATTLAPEAAALIMNQPMLAPISTNNGCCWSCCWLLGMLLPLVLLLLPASAGLAAAARPGSECCTACAASRCMGDWNCCSPHSTCSTSLVSQECWLPFNQSDTMS